MGVQNLYIRDDEVTKVEAYLVLRANPQFERISDAILSSLLSCICESDDAKLSEPQVTELKRHLLEFTQYYEAQIAC